MSESIDYDDLCKHLRELAYDKEARLTGTSMIPLHENTIISILDAIAALREQIIELRENIKALDNSLSEANIKRGDAEADNAALLKMLTDVTAHLVAAHSLLKRGGKKAAPSDKMFNQMLKDYSASIARGRTALLAGKKP